MRILAIETSCDETAIAILENSLGEKNNFNLLSSAVLSQIKIHKPFGGVVPNLAQREHQKNLVPILKLTLKESGLLKIKNKNSEKILNSILEREPMLLGKFKKEILKIKKPGVDAIAVTNGPGLEPALWVGINFAKALSKIWKAPIIPVNHLEGHIYASWLPKTAPGKTLGVFGDSTPSVEEGAVFPKFPLLALIVSGGHTEIILMKKKCVYKIIGETRDDAAGEAFDKVAKMLGLGYPGGPAISRLSEKWKPKNQKPKIILPRPMINSNDFDFSFSGLKTAVLYMLRDNPKINKTEVAVEFQQAIVDVLVTKTMRALKEYGVKSLVVGGGVAANKLLRHTLEEKVANNFPDISLYLSPIWLTGDNAVMIAAAAYFKLWAFGKKAYMDPNKLRANGNLGL